MKKVAPEFKDRLYFINNFLPSGGNVARPTTWNNPMGGALEWVYYPQNAVIDTAGDVRWYMFVDRRSTIRRTIYQVRHHDGLPSWTEDGFLTFGYGQRYAKYDLMGREVFNRRLPAGLRGLLARAWTRPRTATYFLRVSSAGLPPSRRQARPHGPRRDRLRSTRTAARSTTSASSTSSTRIATSSSRRWTRARCASTSTPLRSGQTLSAEELAADGHERYGSQGDIAGVGPGRNWAHVNSVDYDPTDDSIIIAPAISPPLIKIGRDKKVKWIVGSPEGWKEVRRQGAHARRQGRQAA